MPVLTKLNLPILDPESGEVSEQTFNLPGTLFGTCSSSANSRVKEATVDPGFSLVKGVRVAVKYTYTDTYSATAGAPCQLDVNGTGAKNIYYAGSSTPTGANTKAFGTANRYTYYIYDGTYWVFDGSSDDSNTTYNTTSLGFGYGTSDTEEATLEKAVSIPGYTAAYCGIISVRFTNAVPANSTININNTGARIMRYHQLPLTDGLIRAGDMATFVNGGTVYHLIAIDRQPTINGETVIF